MACRSSEHWNPLEFGWLHHICDYLSGKYWNQDRQNKWINVCTNRILPTLSACFHLILENCPDNSSSNIHSLCSKVQNCFSCEGILWFEIYHTGNKTSHLIWPLWHSNSFQMTSRRQQYLFGSNSCLIKGIKLFKKKSLQVHKYCQSGQWCSSMSQCPLSYITLIVLPSVTLKSFQTEREGIFY